MVSQWPMSRCGCCGRIMTGVADDILFLFKLGSRKLHAMPTNTNKMQNQMLLPHHMRQLLVNAGSVLLYRINALWIGNSLRR